MNSSEQNIVSCPFLRNIKEPTTFSFSSSTAIPLVVGGSKGPIFEEGPTFDRAFRVFHGQNGVVPLQTMRSEPAVQRFHPLAAKAATITLSGFGFGFGFGFDAFNDMLKKNQQRKRKSSKKKSSQKQDSKHEAMSEEWLQNGKCPIAKSFRSVTNVVPIITKALKLPSGINYKCPAPIVAARAALAKTAFAKNLRPQPLPAKVVVIGAMGMAANVPLGIWREHTQKFSPSWFAAVHAAVPFIAMLRKSVLMPKSAMAFTIAASVLGQVIGSRAERYWLKAMVSGSKEVRNAGERCGEVEWESADLRVAGPVA